MNKRDITDFFDDCADWWDADMKRNEEVIAKILDNAEVSEGKDVLDIASGTGVLFPDYIGRRAKSIVGIDISPKMAKIAHEKFPDTEIIVGDAEEYDFGKSFDCIMIYNAFPHFVHPEGLIKNLASFVKPGGTFSIAHGMSRQALLRHHKRAEKVSVPLPEAEELAKLLEPYFKIKTVISDDKMYQIVGIKEA